MPAKKMYGCVHCGTTWSSDDLALDCCAPHTEEVWECAVCETVFESEDAAAQCHARDEQGNYIPSAAELEAQGQQRLIP